MTPTDNSDPPPVRVLVVDDDPAVQQLVTLLLTADGCEAVPVGGGVAALELLAVAEFDVALIDLTMPEMNGLGLLTAVRDRDLAVVSVLLTGGSDVGEAVEAMKRGAFDYVAKPINRTLLRRAVSHAAGVARTRRRQRQLERVVSDWAATFDACPDGILVIDPAGRVLRANRAAGELAATTPAGLVGRPLADAFPILGEAGAGDGERVFDAACGRHLHLTYRPIPPADTPSGSVLIVRDVTDAAQAEATHTRLLRQLFSAEEDERRRMARELHDGIGQILASALVGLTLAADRSTAPDHADKLKQLARMVAEASDEARRLAYGLRPSVLDDLGLEAAVRRLAADLVRTHELRVEVTAAGLTDRLPAEVVSVAYRVVQEALANVARHAAASTVSVSLERTDAGVRVTVADDGKGFDPGGRPSGSSGGLGLAGMRERVSLLGGRFRVDTQPGRGTTLEVYLPTGRAGE